MARAASTTAPIGTALGGSDSLALEDRRSLFEHMVLTRAVEERGVTLYKQGKVPGSFYDGYGQEAVAVGAAFALAGEDPICSPLIRDLGAQLVRGTDLTELFRHYMGRENRLSRGREGNIHFGDRTRGVVGPVSMLPDMMVVAAGLAMAFQMRAEARCALTFFGDGATSRGDWHEAMNWAGLYSLPVIFVLENNHYAYSTPTVRQFAVNPVERAAGYGVAAVTVDGNDVEAVFEATRAARERAVAGRGPTLVEAVTMRMHGHGAHDDARYVSKELIATWAKRDPIAVHGSRLAELGVDLDGIRAAVAGRVDAAVAEALQTPMPDPAGAAAGVFCEGEPESLGPGLTHWSGFGERA